MSRSLAPVPFPGESVLGIAARHAAKWYRSAPGGAGSLFGGKAPVTLDLPSQLQSLADHLPPAAGLDPETLAMRHTALPMHLPFLEESKAAEALRLACGSRHLAFALGRGSSRLQTPRNLPLCRACVDDDIRRYGFPVVHREHLVPGLLLCPNHDHPIPLSYSSVVPQAIYGSPGFALPDLTPDVATPPIDATWWPHLESIARDIKELLRGTCPRPGPGRLHAYYYQQLGERHLLRPDGSVRQARLTRQFQDHYGAGLLERLNSKVWPPNRHSWLARLARRPNHHQQPLRHILLMHFFGQTTVGALTAASALSPRAERSSVRPHAHRVRSPSRLAALLPEKQKAWLSGLEKHRNGSLKSAEPALYAWLWRNAPDWLRQHRPPPQPTDRVNHARWSRRDELLVAALPQVAARIRAQRQPFRRASRNAIASGTGHPTWLYAEASHLPQSIRLLNSLAETTEQFAVRRLEEVIRDNPGPRKRWELRVAAGISPQVALKAAVSALLDRAATI
jgi:hypothetical protein